MTKVSRLGVLLLIATALGLAAQTAQAQQPTEIKVGLLVPLSGLYARPGAVMRMGAEMAIAVCQRLRRSRETWERVAFLVRDHLRLLDAREMRLSTLKRFLAQDGIDELLDLARLDAMASNKDLTYHNFCRQKLAELGTAEIKPEPLVRGRDLLDMGFEPGPRIGEILAAVAEAQLDGTLQSREQALAWVRERYPAE